MGRIPPLLYFSRELGGQKSGGSGWHPKKGWQMNVSFGVAIGALGMFIYSGGASDTERIITVVVGAALGGAAGYGAACAMSSTEEIVLGVLCAGLVTIYFIFKESAGAVAAAAPSVASALPLLLA